MQTDLPSHRSPYPEEIVELVRWLTASRGLSPILAPMCLSYPRRIQRTSLPGLHKARRCFRKDCSFLRHGGNDIRGDELRNFVGLWVGLWSVVGVCMQKVFSRPVGRLRECFGGVHAEAFSRPVGRLMENFGGVYAEVFSRPVGRLRAFFGWVYAGVPSACGSASGEFGERSKKCIKCIYCIWSESKVGGCVGEGFQGGVT